MPKLYRAAHKVKFESTIGMFTTVEENQVDACLMGAANKEGKADSILTRVEEVLGHYQKLYDAATRRCKGQEGTWSLASLVTNCSIVLVLYW